MSSTLLLALQHHDRRFAHGDETLEPSGTSIARVMTPAPVVVQQDMSLDDAHELMVRAGIRHLPILNGDRLVDVITDRDLANYRSFVRPGQSVPLCEILTGAVPYVCTPDTPLDVVARCMVATKTDIAVVVDDQMHVIGIFTAVDALRCVGGQLRVG